MYMYIKGIESASLCDSSTDFGNVRTLWYFLFFILKILNLKCVSLIFSLKSIYSHCK